MPRTCSRPDPGEVEEKKPKHKRKEIQKQTARDRRMHKHDQVEKLMHETTRDSLICSECADYKITCAGINKQVCIYNDEIYSFQKKYGF